MEKTKLEELKQLFFEMPPLIQKIKLSYKSAASPMNQFNKNQVIAIMIIGKHGNITPSALSMHMAMEKGSMTTLIDSLVERGLVSRSSAPGDRRRILLSLTDAGVEQKNIIEKHHSKSAEEILSKLNDAEMDELYKSLKTLIKTLETLAER